LGNSSSTRRALSLLLIGKLLAFNVTLSFPKYNPTAGMCQSHDKPHDGHFTYPHAWTTHAWW
jgi:hypothetical protein